jgi:hypothetical protein
MRWSIKFVTPAKAGVQIEKEKEFLSFDGVKE